MFPSSLRKIPPPLKVAAKRELVRVLTRFFKKKSLPYEHEVQQIQDYFQLHFPAQLQTDLLADFIPAQSARSGGDEAAWRFPCVAARDRLVCKIHPECRLVYNRCEQIVHLLFTSDVHELAINLKKVRIPDHHLVVSRIREAFTRPPAVCSNLRTLSLSGGTVHTDDLAAKVEDLCSHMRHGAPNLLDLHLPVCSNLALRSISEIRRLRSLRCDRTKRFNRRGLWHLCHEASRSRYGLQRLHVGVFKHHHFSKVDVREFFTCMKNLKAFSLLDEDRALVKVGNLQGGEKVFTYSVVRLAIIQKMMRMDAKMKAAAAAAAAAAEAAAAGAGNSSTGVYTCGLKEIKVVDKQLKPKYLLESCPELKSLYLDWQEERSLPPFNAFSPAWFTNTLKDPQWIELCKRLSELHLVCPAAHSANHYSLPLEDFTRLMSAAVNLQKLTLEGAGKQSPIPLIPILFHCRQLKELVMEHTAVHVPDNYEVVDQRYISQSLKIFKFLGDMSSLLFHEFLTRGLARYMPELRELEIQPETIMGYQGLKLDQVRELDKLPKLSKLSIPLSCRECIMNMPELIYVFREFTALRFLILSWGLWCDSYDINTGRINYLMQWLYNAFGAENANIHLQLNYKMHTNMYTNPPY